MDGWMDGWMNEWTDEHVDRWMEYISMAVWQYSSMTVWHPAHHNVAVFGHRIGYMQQVLYMVSTRPDRWTFALQEVCEAVLAQPNK